MQTAKDTKDLVNVAEALSIASHGGVKLMSPEHAKSVWLEYLKISGYDSAKKVFSKSEVQSTEPAK